MEGTVDGLTEPSSTSETSSSKDKMRRSFGARLGPTNGKENYLNIYKI